MIVDIATTAYMANIENIIFVFMICSAHMIVVSLIMVNVRGGGSSSKTK